MLLFLYTHDSCHEYDMYVLLGFIVLGNKGVQEPEVILHCSTRLALAYWPIGSLIVDSICIIHKRVMSK